MKKIILANLFIFILLLSSCGQQQQIDELTKKVNSLENKLSSNGLLVSSEDVNDNSIVSVENIDIYKFVEELVSEYPDEIKNTIKIVTDDKDSVFNLDEHWIFDTNKITEYVRVWNEDYKNNYIHFIIAQVPDESLSESAWMSLLAGTVNFPSPERATFVNNEIVIREISENSKFMGRYIYYFKCENSNEVAKLFTDKVTNYLSEPS